MSRRSRRRKREKLLDRMMASRDWEATLIILSATLVASTRWIEANMHGEGLAIPQAWMVWWEPLSGFLSACMAIVEAWGFGYILARLGEKMKKSQRKAILALTAAALISFAIVLTPSIMSNIQDMPLYDVLGRTWIGSAIWSLALAMSTITIVAAVGYSSLTRKRGQADTKRK